MITIITEKPAAGRDIARVLGVTGTPKGYMEDKGAAEQLEVIRSVFDRSERIIAATDAGREGELIFRYIYRFLDCKKPFSRLWLSSLTDKAIREGFEHLKDGSDYDSLYLAAKARNEADWLIGMNACKALSNLMSDGNNSLGRVQTPTLSMICARYSEHRSFVATAYLLFSILLEKDGTTFRMTCREKFADRQKAEEIQLNFPANGMVVITKTEQKEAVRMPPLLYDLTSLQQDANNRHGFTAEQTLNIAQNLYESKLISYPRTSSKYIPEDVFATIPALVRSLEQYPVFACFARGMDTAKLNVASVDDNKITDHHALIITDRYPSELFGNEKVIYEMVTGRMLEAFSTPCITDVLSVQATYGEMIFEARGSQIKDAGWRGVFMLTDEQDEDKQIFPPLAVGETLPCVSNSLVQKKTIPKPLYNEATLLGAMEGAGKELENEEERAALKNCGIGTPATRAGIIETLLKRHYIEREKKFLVPTEKGLQIYQAVKEMQIADVRLTGQWESKLDAIEQGTSSPEVFSQEIRDYTLQIIDEISRMELPESEQVFVCPKCRVGKVAVGDKVAKCNYSGCNLTVFRSVCGKYLSLHQVANLFRKGRTDIFKGMKNKKGDNFDALLKFDKDFNVVFEYARTKTGKKM